MTDLFQEANNTYIKINALKNVFETNSNEYKYLDYILPILMNKYRGSYTGGCVDGTGILNLASMYATQTKLAYGELKLITENIKEYIKKDEKFHIKMKQIKINQINEIINKILEDESDNKFIDFSSFAIKWEHEFNNKYKKEDGFLDTNLCISIYNIWIQYLEKKLILITDKIIKNTPYIELENIKSNIPFDYKVKDFNQNNKEIIIKYYPIEHYESAIELNSDLTLELYNRIIAHLITREEYFEKEHKIIQQQNILEKEQIGCNIYELFGITEEDIEMEALKKVLIEEKYQIIKKIGSSKYLANKAYKPKE